MLKHETDLPTKHEEKTTQARLSKENENPGRTSSHQTSQTKRQKALNCLKRRFLFPKSVRIRKRSHFLRLLKEKNRWKGIYVVIDFRFNESSLPKLGITVTKRFGKAVLRNRFKRLTREAFRTNLHSFPSSIEINVFPRDHQHERDHQQEIALCNIQSDFFSFLSWLPNAKSK